MREAQRRLSVTPAGDADACGAPGCRETEWLVRVTVDGETRVLCEGHAGRWVRG